MNTAWTMMNFDSLLTKMKKGSVTCASTRQRVCKKTKQVEDVQQC